MAAGKPVAQLAEELCVSSNLLYNWRLKSQEAQGGSAGARAVGEASSKGRNSRDRLFSMADTFWVFLFQVMSPFGTCREAVRKAQFWWYGSKKAADDMETSAYCQARARLPFEVLARHLRTLAGSLCKRVLTDELWLGERRVRVLDGTGHSMPDTEKNQCFAEGRTCGRTLDAFAVGGRVDFHEVAGVDGCSICVTF